MAGTMNQMNTYQPTLGIPFFDESFFEKLDTKNFTSLQRNLYQYYCGFGDFQWEERVKNQKKNKPEPKPKTKEEGSDDGIIKRGGEHTNPREEREGK